MHRRIRLFASSDASGATFPTARGAGATIASAAAATPEAKAPPPVEAGPAIRRASGAEALASARDDEPLRAHGARRIEADHVDARREAARVERGALGARLASVRRDEDLTAERVHD